MGDVTYIVGLQFDPDPERKRSKVGILENFLKCLLVLQKQNVKLGMETTRPPENICMVFEKTWSKISEKMITSQWLEIS